MGNTVDNRVVELGFDNRAFESGVKGTLTLLDRLKSGLNFDKTSKSLSSLSGVAKNFTLENIASGVQNLSNRFSTLGIIGLTVLQNLTNSAINYGKKIYDNLTKPIKTGLEEYETQLNAIQTVLANTQSKGTTLDDVNRALDELNTYADKTIYNFTEMTRNIGTFTAAGVGLEASTQAIKGIANLAAVSGSNSQQASTAMYQLSQALSTGTVKLMDWNSVVNAGMGGQVFQDALKETARAHGVAVDSIIEKEGSFRDSLSTGWLSSDILLETLNKFTGDLTEEQLKAMGYTEEQIAGIIQLGQTASDAATKVKTFSQLTSTLQEAMQSGWAQSWRIILGDFEEARTLFTEISDTLGAIIAESSDARNKLLQGWKDLGGRNLLIISLRNAFEGLLSIIEPISQAFKEIFPPLTAQTLFNITLTVKKLSEHLKISGETAEKLKTIFKGIFSVLDIFRMLIVAVVESFLKLISPMAAPTGNTILTFLSNLATYAIYLRDLIITNDTFRKSIAAVIAFISGYIPMLKTFFENVGNFFELVKIKFDIFKESVSNSTFFQNASTKILNFFKSIWESIKSLKTVDLSFFSGITESIKNAFSNLDPIAKEIGSKFTNFMKLVGESIKNSMKKTGSFALSVSDVIKNIFESIGNLFSKIDFSKFSFTPIFDTLGKIFAGGLAGGGLLIIGKIVKGLGDLFSTFFTIAKTGRDVVNGVVGILEGVSGTLEAMQTKLKAEALVKIAIAIGLLALSLIALTLVDPEKMKGAIIALTTLFADLFGSMAIYQKTTGSTGVASMAQLVVGMIGVALALLILSGVVKSLGDMDPEKLKNGLIGFSAIMAQMVVMMVIMSKGPADLKKTSVGLALTALSMMAIVKSVKKLGDMDWDQMIRGLVGVTIIFAEIIIFIKAVNAAKLSPKMALSLIGVAVAIELLSGTVKKFGEMKPETLVQGLKGVGAILAELGIFLRLAGNGKLLISTAIALGVMALALGLLSDIIVKMGELPVDTVNAGLTTMAYTLGIIGVAMNVFPKDMLAKAVGLTVVAVALMLLNKTLTEMGKMEWEEIKKGLVLLGGSMLILALGINAMQGALAGAVALLVVAGALAILTPVLKALGSMSLQEIGLALLALAGTFLVLGIAGYFLAPVVPVLFGLAAAMGLISLASLAFGAALVLLSIGLASLAISGVAGATAFVAMVGILLTLIPIVITAIMGGIVLFAKLIIESAPVIGKAILVIFNTILDIIIGIIPKLVEALGTLLSGLITLIQDNIPDFVDALFLLISELLDTLVENIPKFVQSGIDIIMGLLEGIRDNIKEMTTVAIEIVTEFIDGVAEKLPDIIDSGINLIVSFIQGLADGIDKHSEEINKAIVDLAAAIVKGFTDGLTSGVGGVVDAIKKISGAAVQALKTLLGIFSPSRVFRDLGGEVPIGFALGIDKFGNRVEIASDNLGEKAINGMNSAIASIKDSLTSDLNMSPVIRPVIDLEELNAGTRLIDKLLGNRSFSLTPALASNVSNGFYRNSPLLPDNPSYGTNISMTQNNYSPKALSAYDIYRQTRRQIVDLKGLIE